MIVKTDGSFAALIWTLILGILYLLLHPGVPHPAGGGSGQGGLPEGDHERGGLPRHSALLSHSLLHAGTQH